MRSYIAFLLLALFSVSSLSAQLYDNRSRYLRAPYDDYDDRYEDRRETHHQPKTNYRHTTNKYRRSYYSYHKNVRRHTRPYLDVDELYREFRDPDVYYRYKYDSPYSNNNNPDEPKFEFNCFCWFPIDIASLINWFGSQEDEIKKARDTFIDGMEEEYLEELNERYPSYRKETSFEKAQKDFFKRYVGKFNSWYSQGEKVTYSDYQKRFVHKLSERLEVFETALEPSMASSKVVSELKKHRDRKANLNRAFGDLKINNKLVREMPSSQYRNYDLSYGGYRSGVSVVQKMVSERDLYKHFSGTSNNLNDYMSQQYINQYKKEDNLEERFALMSAYLVDMKENSYRPPSNKIPPKGFMHHVPYDFDDIYKHYYKSIDDFGINSLISFSKAKALVAIINYPDQIKKILEEGGLKGSAIDYFKNAVPVNYELNTIENAVLSRIKNQAFNWDELKNLPYYNHQNSKNPEVVMSIDLRKRTFLNFHDRKFFDVDIVLNGGLTLAEYNMHKGIGEVLNDLYNNSKYWYAEGATIRHFLKAKGVNIPNSLSNYNLGKLFDFGGGNTNTLTIQFSDFAKKYIKNFHHGDGIYGTSLFTDPFKLIALEEILKGNEVDFEEFSYNDLWDDQNPYDDWNRLTDCEKDFFKKNPQHLYTARGNKKAAEKASWYRFSECKTPKGTPMHNTIGDAYRHAYFAALNTHNMGYINAKVLGDAHECDVPSNKSNEKQMDLHNNAWGYHYGSTVSYVNEKQFYDSFIDAFNKGQIKILQECQ